MATRDRFPVEFLKKIPKTDLHVHLDGSLRLSTVVELAKKDGLKLPYDNEADLRKHVFKPKTESLRQYLACFKYTTMVMQSPENLERVAYEFAEDNYSEGVRYFEVRFAPQLHAHMHMTDGGQEMDIQCVIRSVNRGLQRATDVFNSRIVDPDEPEYRYGIIVSALRMFTGEMSDYYKSLMLCHKHEPKSRIYGLASMALIMAAVDIKQREGLPIVALDIAGAEVGYPAKDHVDAYRYAHKHFVHTTCHAGESYGPTSIFQAITELKADRIGHGFHIFSDTLVTPEDGVHDAKQLVDNIVQFVAQRRITLEVCLTSNLGTMPELKLPNHPFNRMMEERLSVTLCTDNRLVSNTSTVKELALASSTFGLTPKQMRDVVITGFKGSFFAESYKVKRAYVRKVINYYDKIAAKYGVVTHNARPSTS